MRKVAVPGVRIVAFAGLCLATIFAAAQIAAARNAANPESPTPTPPSVLPVPDMTDSGRFSARLVQVEDDLIVRAYTRALHERYGDSREGRAQVRERLDWLRGHPDQIAHEDVTIASGEFAGHWSFASPDGGLPTRAWRDIDRSGAHGYEAERIGYCIDEPAACADWFERGRDRSIAPDPRAGERAERQWAGRALRESCAARPARRPSTMSLHTAAARAGLGQAEIVVEMLHNPCGEVRLARIAKSSGNADVDRAAIAWAQKVVAPLQGEPHGYTSRVPMRFFDKDPPNNGADAPR
jgi:TonB family protein